MPICLGSVSNVENTVSQSLKPIHEEVLEMVQNAKVVHVDETGHKESKMSFPLSSTQFSDSFSPNQPHLCCLLQEA